MKKYYADFSPERLKTNERVTYSGQQYVGPGGVPEWVGRAFEDNPDIEIIAIGRRDNSEIWRRTEERAKLEKVSFDDEGDWKGILLDWSNHRHHYIKIEPPFDSKAVAQAFERGLSIIRREEEEGLI